MEMRRHDREILDEAKIDEIISACTCCRLGFADGAHCYIVPLSFGFAHDEQRIFYFHSAREGRKLSLVRALGRAGFELDGGYALHGGKTPCQYSCAFQSVIGEGAIEEVTDPAEKRRALSCILSHTAGKDGPWDFPAGAENTVAILKLTVETLTCKVHA